MYTVRVDHGFAFEQYTLETFYHRAKIASWRKDGRISDTVNRGEKTETMIGMQKAIDNRGVIKG